MGAGGSVTMVMMDGNTGRVVATRNTTPVTQS